MRGTRVKRLNRLFRLFPPVPGSTSRQRLVAGEPMTARVFRKRIANYGAAPKEKP